jgi:SAM-dependent methyltransferase
MHQTLIWDVDLAQHYDTRGTGMFAPDVLGPTVDRLAELAGDGRALEFAIGTGRVAVPLSQQGVPVTGIELSRPMIDQLRTKADEATIPVIVGDMATAVAPGEYTLVYLVYNTIANLQTRAEQVECFRNAARHLMPGGRFVVELWVPELRKLPPGQHAMVWHCEPGYIGWTPTMFCASTSCRTTLRSMTANRRSYPAARAATSGRPSSTSWLSWPVSRWRPGMQTGPEPSSPPKRVPTYLSIASRRVPSTQRKMWESERGSRWWKIGRMASGDFISRKAFSARVSRL